MNYWMGCGRLDWASLLLNFLLYASRFQSHLGNDLGLKSAAGTGKKRGHPACCSTASKNILVPKNIKYINDPIKASSARQSSSSSKSSNSAEPELPASSMATSQAQPVRGWSIGHALDGCVGRMRWKTSQQFSSLWTTLGSHARNESYYRLTAKTLPLWNNKGKTTAIWFLDLLPPIVIFLIHTMVHWFRCILCIDGLVFQEYPSSWLKAMFCMLSIFFAGSFMLLMSNSRTKIIF